MSPYLLGALNLLAESYSDPQELNRGAYHLYCEFRPEFGGWGAKGTVSLDTILGLRKKKEELDLPASKKLKVESEPSETVVDDELVEGDEDFTLWDLFEGQE